MKSSQKSEGKKEVSNTFQVLGLWLRPVVLICLNGLSLQGRVAKMVGCQG